MFISDSIGRYARIPDGSFTCDTIPSGVYNVAHSDGNIILVSTRFSGEAIVNLDIDVARKIRREIRNFFDIGIISALKNAKLMNRRGILIHGQIGCGKTTIVRSLAPLSINNNAVIISDPHINLIHHAIDFIRYSDPNRPIVCVLDELDRYMNYEDELATILDGVNSPDNFLFIATTNRIDDIPLKIRMRPSRISLVIEMPSICEDDRMVYAANKFSMLDPRTILNIVKMTLHLPIDYVGEACRLSIMGYTEDEISERIPKEFFDEAYDSDE